MGAIQESNAIFLSIANGKISRRVKSPTKTSVERTTKEGKIVHEEVYKGWRGRITDVQVREHAEYGKFWNVTLSDDDGEAVLQMNYSSGYSGAFLKLLPNIELSAPIDITPKLTIEGDKKKTSLFISQFGEPLKWAFTRDNPNGLPPLQKIKVKGKETWDDSDMMEFFEAMVKRDILPQLKAKPYVKNEAATVSEDPQESYNEERDGPLPF